MTEIRVTDSQKDSPNGPKSLAIFLADHDDGTKERYAKELSHANGEWQKPLDLRYAESLVYFGLLERRVTTLYRGPHVRGSRTEYRRAA